MKKLLLKNRDDFLNLLSGYDKYLDLARKFPQEYPCYIILAKVRHNMCIDYVFVYKKEF